MELLLGDRPKFECMEDCRKAIRFIKQQAQVKIQEADLEIQNIGILEEGADVEKWEKCIMKIIASLSNWYHLVKAEVKFIEECVDRLPNDPALLYAIAPPPEALPRFYPVLYPGVT